MSIYQLYIIDLEKPISPYLQLDHLLIFQPARIRTATTWRSCSMAWRQSPDSEVKSSGTQEVFGVSDTLYFSKRQDMPRST